MAEPSFGDMAEQIVYTASENHPSAWVLTTTMAESTAALGIFSNSRPLAGPGIDLDQGWGEFGDYSWS